MIYIEYLIRYAANFGTNGQILDLDLFEFLRRKILFLDLTEYLTLYAAKCVTLEDW